MSEERDTKLKPPVLKESDIADEPERRVERHLTWSLKFEYFLNTIDGYRDYLTMDIPAITAQFIAANPAPPEITDAQLAINVAAYVANAGNIAATTALLRNHAGAANIIAYLTKEANTSCKTEQLRVNAIFELHQKKIEDITKKERKCFAYLISALEEPLITKYQIGMLPPAQQTPMNIWRIIHDDFHRTDAATRLYYTTKFDRLKFDPSTTLKTFGVHVRQASNHLLSVGINKDDDELKTVFMNKVKDVKKYRGLIAGALNFPQAMSFEEMCASLQNQADILLYRSNDEIVYHDKIKRKRYELVDPQPKRKLLTAGNKPKGVSCSFCGRKGHTVDNCWDKHPEKRAGFKFKKRKVTKTSTSAESGESSAESSDEKPVKSVKSKPKFKSEKAKVRIMNVLRISRSNNQSKNRNVMNNIKSIKTDMIMDSGSESTVLKEPYGILENITDTNLTLIYGDGVQDEALNVGNVGELEEVVISNTITDNILSLSQMADIGYITIITGDKMYLLKAGTDIVFKQSDIAIIGKRVGNLYKCELEDFSKTLRNVSVSKTDVA